MRILRTYTKHYELETRQYELFGVDLGEGIRRRGLLIGAAIVAAWMGLFWGIGVPLRPGTFIGWVLPPALLAYYAIQPDASGRRPRLAEWVDLARYGLIDRRPLTGLRLGPGAERALTLRLTARLLPTPKPEVTRTPARERR